MTSYKDLINSYNEAVTGDNNHLVAFSILTALPYAFLATKEDTPYESVLFTIAYADAAYRDSTGGDLLDDIADILAETPEPFDKILRESLALYLAIIDFATTCPGESISVEASQELADETLRDGGMLC